MSIIYYDTIEKKKLGKVDKSYKIGKSEMVEDLRVGKRSESGEILDRIKCLGTLGSKIENIS